MFSRLKFLRLAGLITLCLAGAGVAQASIVIFEVSTVANPAAAEPFAGQGLAVSWTMTDDVPAWTLNLLNLYRRTEMPVDPIIPVNEVPLTVELRRGTIVSAPIAQGSISGLGLFNSKVSPLGGPRLFADTYFLLVYPSDVTVPYSTSWVRGGSPSTLAPGVTMGSEYFVQLDGGGAPVDYLPTSLGLGVSLEGYQTPEPATFVLFGAGLLGLGVWRRRRA